MGNRLRILREERRWTIEEAAAKFGMSRSGYNKIERGERRLDNDKIQKAANVFGVPGADILGISDVVVPLRGFVGAGQTIYQFSDDEGGWADAPPGTVDSTAAVEVRGDSMLPLYETGTLLYYSRQLPPHEMVGQRCIVQLEDDRVLVKTLRRGSERGLYTLVSLNAPDIEDVAVRWAAPIDWIRPSAAASSTYRNQR